MSKYHFHLRHRGAFIRDWHGVDMPSLHAAEEHASLLAEQISRTCKNSQHTSLEISDERDRVLGVIHIRQR